MTEQRDEANRDDATAREEERLKRPTVIVTNGAGRALQIALHQIHTGFMGAETRVPHGDIITLAPGPNPGIDKEWFDAWREENAQFALLTGGQITWVDGEPKGPDEPLPRGGVDSQPQSQPDSIAEMRQTGDRPLLVEPEPEPATDEKPSE